MLTALIAIPVVAYLAVLAYLYFNQRQLLYFPDRSRPQLGELRQIGVRDVLLTTADGLDLLSWYLPPREGRPVIAYFHGNGGALSIADVARSLQISESYIRQLLAENGTTFTDFVLAGRLTRAHRMLLDPRYADRSISAVAYEAGFGDLSYFNRTFRRRYGATPSQVRQDALHLKGE